MHVLYICVRSIINASSKKCNHAFAMNLKWNVNSSLICRLQLIIIKTNKIRCNFVKVLHFDSRTHSILYSIISVHADGIHTNFALHRTKNIFYFQIEISYTLSWWYYMMLSYEFLFSFYQRVFSIYSTDNKNVSQIIHLPLIFSVWLN